MKSDNAGINVTWIPDFTPSIVNGQITRRNVVKGDAPTNGCVAGGADCASKVAAILGQAGVEVKPKVAFLACAGSKDCAQDKAEYIVKVVNTYEQAKTVSIVLKGMKQISNASVIKLDLSQYDLENTVDNPNAIEPKEEKVEHLGQGGNAIMVNLPAKSFYVYKVKK